MRFDAGKVENSRTTIDFLSTNHITHEPSGVDGQYQNPVERYVQTVDKGVAAMIYASKSFDFTFWGMALLSYIHSYNMCPNKLSGEYSPIFHLNSILFQILGIYVYFLLDNLFQLLELKVTKLGDLIQITVKKLLLVQHLFVMEAL